MVQLRDLISFDMCKCHVCGCRKTMAPKSSSLFKASASCLTSWWEFWIQEHGKYFLCFFSLILSFNRYVKHSRVTSSPTFHRFYCVVSIVVDSMISVFGRGVSETSNVYHITVVESHKHGQDPVVGCTGLGNKTNKQKTTWDYSPNRTLLIKSTYIH